MQLIPDAGVTVALSTMRNDPAFTGATSLVESEYGAVRMRTPGMEHNRCFVS